MLLVLSLVPALKKQFNEFIIRKSQTNKDEKLILIIINIEEFDSKLRKIDKNSYKDIDIYYNGYITSKKTGGCENIYSVNPWYLIIGKVDGHIEEKNGSKYLIFDSTDENRNILEK